METRNELEDVPRDTQLDEGDPRIQLNDLARSEQTADEDATMHDKQLAHDVYDKSLRLDVPVTSEVDLATGAASMLEALVPLDSDENVTTLSDMQHNQPTDIFENSMPVNQAEAEKMKRNGAVKTLVIEDQLDLNVDSSERTQEGHKPADGIAVHGRNSGKTFMQIYRKASPTSKQLENMNNVSPSNGSELKGQHTFGLIPAAASGGEAARHTDVGVVNRDVCGDDQSNTGGDTQVIEFLATAGNDTVSKTDEGVSQMAQPEVVGARAAIAARQSNSRQGARSRQKVKESGYESQFHALLAARNIRVDEMRRSRDEEQVGQGLVANNPETDDTTSQPGLSQKSPTYQDNRAADALQEKLMEMQASFDEEQREQDAKMDPRMDDTEEPRSGEPDSGLAAQLTFQNNVFDIAIKNQTVNAAPDNAYEDAAELMQEVDANHLPSAITEATQEGEASAGTGVRRYSPAMHDQVNTISATRTKALGDILGGVSQTRAKSSQLGNSNAHQQKKLKALGAQRALQRSTRDTSRKEAHNFATAAHRTSGEAVLSKQRQPRTDHLTAFKTLNSSRSLKQTNVSGGEMTRTQSRGQVNVECASAVVRPAVTNMNMNASVTSSQKQMTKLQAGNLTILADSARESQEDANQPVGTVTETEIKQEMVDAFKKIRLDTYSDILRIKKPQMQAFVASQLLCRVVNSFRGGAQKHDGVDSKFQHWQGIQDFVHKKPNVIKFNQEITQLIQHMILSKDYLKQIRSDQLRNHLSKIQKIQQQFFGLKSKNEIIRQFQTTRNFAAIVLLCFCIVRYVLYQAGKKELLNLKAEVAELTPTSRAASRSNRSNSNRRGAISKANVGSDYDNDSCDQSHVSSNMGGQRVTKHNFTVGRSRANDVSSSFFSHTGQQSTSATRQGNGYASRGKLGAHQQRTSLLSSSQNEGTRPRAMTYLQKKPLSRQLTDNLGNSQGRQQIPSYLKVDDLDRNQLLNRLSTPKQTGLDRSRFGYAGSTEPQQRLNESAQNFRRVPFITNKATSVLSQSAMVGAAARNQENISETDSFNLQRRKQSKALLITKASKPTAGYFERTKSSLARTRVSNMPSSATLTTKERKKKTDQLRAMVTGTGDNFFRKSKKEVDTPSDTYQPKSPQKENKFSPKRKVRSPLRASQGSPLEVQTSVVESAANELTQKLEMIKADQNRPKQHHQKITKAQSTKQTIITGAPQVKQTAQAATKKSTTQNKKQIAMIHKERQDLESRYERLTLSAISGNSNPSGYRSRKAPGLTLQQMPQVSGGAHGALPAHMDCFALQEHSTVQNKVEESARFSTEVDDARRAVVPGKESVIQNAANAVDLNFSSSRRDLNEGIFEKSGGNQEPALLMPSVITQSNQIQRKSTTPHRIGKDSERSASAEGGSATIKRQRKSRQERSQERKKRIAGQKLPVQMSTTGEYQEQPTVVGNDDLDEFLQLETICKSGAIDSANQIHEYQDTFEERSLAQPSIETIIPHEHQSISQASVSNQQLAVAPVPMERPSAPLFDFQSEQHKSISVTPNHVEPTAAFNVPGFESRSESENDESNQVVKHVSIQDYGTAGGEKTDEATPVIHQSPKSEEVVDSVDNENQKLMNAEEEFEARVTKAQEEARAIAMLLKAEDQATSSGDPTESRAEETNVDLPSRSDGLREETVGTYENATANHLINLDLPRLPLETAYEAAEDASTSLIQGYTEPSGRVQTQRNDVITAGNASHVLEMMAPQSSNLAGSNFKNERRPGTSAFEEKHNKSVQNGNSSSKKKKKQSANVVRRLYPRSPVQQLKSPTKSSSVSNSVGAASKGLSKKSPQVSGKKSASANKQNLSSAKKGAALPSVFGKTKQINNSMTKSGKKASGGIVSSAAKQPQVTAVEAMQIVERDAYSSVHNQSVDEATHEPLDLRIASDFKINNFFTTIEDKKVINHEKLNSISVAESQRTHVLPDEHDKVFGQAGDSKFVAFVNSPSTHQAHLSPQRELKDHDQQPVEESKSENVADSRSSRSSENQMQEIMSPFKQLRIMKDPSAALDDDRPSPPPQAAELVQANVQGWKINPVRVSTKRFDEQLLADFDSVASRRLQSIKSFEEQLNSYSNNYLKRKEPRVSGPFGAGVGSSLVVTSNMSEPGVVQRRSDVFEHLLTKQQEIEANSPTRNSLVNLDVIQQLKERRMQQREELNLLQQSQENLRESDDE